MSKSNKEIKETKEVKEETPIIPMPVADNIIDLDTDVIQKKKFRFCKDNNRIVELNVSDMNFMARLTEAYPKLKEQQEEAAKLMDGITAKADATDEETLAEMKIFGERLRSIDTKMRELIDFIFNADVSAKAAPDGSMYDPFEGSFRFEYIITLLVNQYGENFTAEFAKMEKQISKHTEKYTKG